MSAAALYRHEFIVCPWCDAESGNRVDHLYGDAYPISFGPWHCDKCRGAFVGEVTARGHVTVSKRNSEFVRCVALLKRETTDGPLYFVIKHDRYAPASETADEALSSEKYFFEEHSCPTNWLRDCLAVIDQGNDDPHGFLEFVAMVDVPADFDWDRDRAQLGSLIPETVHKALPSS